MKKGIELTEKEQMFAEGLRCASLYLEYMIHLLGIEIGMPNDDLGSQSVDFTVVDESLGIMVECSTKDNNLVIDLGTEPRTIRKTYKAWCNRSFKTRSAKVHIPHKAERGDLAISLGEEAEK